MQMPSDDHTGWDRLLAAVLGDPPSSDDQGPPQAAPIDRSDERLLELVPDWAHDEAS